MAQDRRPHPLRVPILLFAAAASLSLALLLWRGDQPAADLARLWPVTPIAFFAAAFANATAIGGGFLFVPLFVVGYQLPPLLALKLSLGTQSIGMSSGALGWSRRFIDGRALGITFGFAAIGMVLGTFVWSPSPLQVKAVFGWVSLAIAGAMLLELRFGGRANADAVPTPGPGELALYGLACVAGGMITAWVSLAIGEVVALWLLFRHRVRIEKAIGTGVAALALCSLLGTAMHVLRDPAEFPWVYLAFTAPGVAAGGCSGALAGRALEARMAAKGRKSPLKTVFVVVVLLDGLGMLLHVALTH